MANTKTPTITYHKQCPYCGRLFKTKAEGQKYCTPCFERGLHWLHETLGKTNGWDKKVA